jgi:hypothetical protein
MRQPFLYALAAVILLTGCDSVKETLGRTKRSPDEFAVYQRAPLSVPPSYGLRPPAAGPENVNPANDPTSMARQAVLGTGAPTPGATSGQSQAPVGSAGVQALLKGAGALNTDPGIRATVNRETNSLQDDEKSFTDRIIFWQKPEAPSGTQVDPQEEARRIQSNQALGRPITDGDTPTIQRKDKGLLEGLF